MSKKMKKLLILNIPYLVLGLLFTKLPEAWRYASGIDLGQKILNLGDGLSQTFEVPFPSFYPTDLFIGLAIGALLRLIIYVRSKNAKKYRKGVEYGSARWGNAKDIEPYVDPTFQNNVLLTQTERLTMNNRPKDPKTARNKNVLIVGGSGSGKTSDAETFTTEAINGQPEYIPSLDCRQLYEYKRKSKNLGNIEDAGNEKKYTDTHKESRGLYLVWV